ncbi:MAG: 3-deoxy-D-manno-octulosonic acid transferase [Planctomycetota bacterium]|nr:3-deoxy-D-manno-octulosonic acid transferase [Planctomycetota bacterium]
MSLETPLDPGPPEAQSTGAGWGFDVLYAVLAVLYAPMLLYRRLILRKDRFGGRQKRGHVPQRPEHPKRIWIHAVSVGEAKATNVLAKQLALDLPGAEVVFSTTTDTGQEVAKKLYGEERVFYFPLDFSRCVKRALDRVRPSLVILMELEVWPNFTAECAKRGIPVVVLNGRMTERSAARYRRGLWLVGSSFRRVRRWLMQDEAYAERILGMGVDPARVEVAGNVKYDDVETELEPGRREAVRRELGLAEDAQVLIGGSTHPTEEAALLGACRLLKPKYPRLRLILCPRHPHRLAEVEKEIAAHGHAVLKHSAVKARGPAALEELPEPARGDAVVLIDTMGELTRLYAGADIAFVGGSLIPHGGQNVMEPAGLGLACVYGPYMQNFGEAALILRDCDGAKLVEHAEALRATLDLLLSDAGGARAMGSRARAAFLQRQGATERCVGYIRKLLEG